MTDTELVTRLVNHTRALGVEVEYAELPDDGAFLPGVMVRHGGLVVDSGKLRWPGDILHEAGHIAVSAPSRRAALDGKLRVTAAEEMAAMAWSFAAAVAGGFAPQIVFHEGGYRNGGAQLAEQYASGLPPGGPGVPMLQWWGMTNDFPRMNHWLRQIEDPV